MVAPWRKKACERATRLAAAISLMIRERVMMVAFSIRRSDAVLYRMRREQREETKGEEGRRQTMAAAAVVS